MNIKKISPVLVAVLAFVVGAFWYSPYWLGRLWQKAVKVKASG